ncbi:MAG: enoyl-CoA hydratase/isomerase family protein [Acidobacteria bacterium]|nr:enoyl-CoA hydratase/isomerase family protein [Acidobacteriota bacterium]
MKAPVRLTFARGLGWIELASPILSQDVLHALASVLASASAHGGPFVIRSLHPTTFLAGAHLGEIASIDARSAELYARRGRNILDAIRRLPGPVVAAVHGPCMGGGLDLALACDAIVASPNALFAHPGAKRGLVTGWGGTAFLPAAAGPSQSRRAFLTGEPLSARDAHAAGWVQQLSETPTAAAGTLARELASLHRGRLELWRAWRDGRFIDRFRSYVVHNQSTQYPLRGGEFA